MQWYIHTHLDVMSSMMDGIGGGEDGSVTVSRM